MVVPPGTDEGCKAPVRVQGRDTTIVKGSSRIDCSKKSLGGVSGQDIQAVQMILGKKVVSKSGIHIAGQCTGSHCNGVIAP